MRRIMTLLAILLAFGAMSASAQTPSPVSIYAGGLMSFPSAPDNFSSSFENGWHAYVGVGMKAMPMLQLVGKAELHTFGQDFDELGLEDLDGGSARIWMFGADGRFSINVPSFPIKPFLLAGGGFARVSQNEYEGTLATAYNETRPAAETDFYYNFGGGVNLASTPAFSLFAMARYVSIQTEGDPTTYIPITIGLKFF